MSSKRRTPFLSTTATLKLFKLTIRRFWISSTHFWKMSYASACVMSEMNEAKEQLGIFKMSPESHGVGTHLHANICQKYWPKRCRRTLVPHSSTTLRSQCNRCSAARDPLFHCSRPPANWHGTEFGCANSRPNFVVWNVPPISVPIRSRCASCTMPNSSKCIRWIGWHRPYHRSLPLANYRRLCGSYPGLKWEIVHFRSIRLSESIFFVESFVVDL